MENRELYHYGVKGMKWGHRKNVYDINASYYNKRADKLSARADRNRTMARMNRSAANSGSGLIAKANRINENYYQKRADKLSARADRNRTMARMNENASKQRNAAKAANREARANKAEVNNKPEKKGLSDRQKTALKIGAAAAGTALAAYGTYKLNKFVREKHEMLAIGRKSLELDSIRPFMESRAKFHQLDPNSSAVQNEINAIYRGTVNQIKNDARKDSFRTAAKDVYDNRKYLIDKARKEKWLKRF